MPKRNEKMKLVISCGGTGGHFYPGLSAARELNSAGGEAMLLLSGVNAANQGETAAKFGVKNVVLPPMPSPRPKNIFAFLRGLKGGIFMAKRAIREFRPDAFLGMGSFASLPPFLAAKFAGLPVFLHDGNARIGKANRLFSRAARRLWTAFPAVNANKIKCPCSVIGMPLRPELTRCAPLSRAEAVENINTLFHRDLHNDLPTLLIFGGSQGAQIFNRTLPAVLKELNLAHPIQVIHLTGNGKLDEVARAYENVAFPLFLAPACDRMDLLMQAADLAICRSGGSTVAELAFFGLPSVLIPYPYAAEGHQTDNAHYLSDGGAAELLENRECTEKKLSELLSAFLNDPKRLRLMRESARKKARPQAAFELLEQIQSDLRP